MLEKIDLAETKVQLFLHSVNCVCKDLDRKNCRNTAAKQSFSFVFGFMLLLKKV